MLPFFKIYNLTIYSYPLLMGVAWAIAYHLVNFLNIRFEIKFEKLKIFFWGCFLSSWLGAKLFFILTSQGLADYSYINSANFWLGGGFVFYGGLIFAFIFYYLFNRMYPQHIDKYYIFIPALGLGHAIGRLGCLLAGCCYGIETDHGFSIHLHGANRVPIQLYESLGLLLITFFILKKLKSEFNIIALYLLLYSVLRFVLEFYRGDGIRGVWIVGLSTSQIISMVIVAGMSINLALRAWRKSVAN